VRSANYKVPHYANELTQLERTE